MQLKFKKIFWTQHSIVKMKQYGISKSKVLNLLHKPERTEQGFVPGTMGMMKTNKLFNNITFKKNLRLDLKVKTKWQPAFAKASACQRKAPGEIWLMYKDTVDQRKIISVWRYPGVSKPGEEMPLPDDLKIEIMNNKNFFDNLK